MIPAQHQERRVRTRGPRVGRHRSAEGAENFSSAFNALGQLAYSGARVSASAVDLNSGRTLLAIDDRIVLPTAGVGRVLLLIEVSARLSERDSLRLGILEKKAADAVGTSGLWRHLQAPALPIADLATLIGATGDNLATNILLREVGLDAVRLRAESLGLGRTALLDRVREARGPDDAPHLSVGSTVELSRLFTALSLGQIMDRATSQRVLGWLSLGADLSMVASAFGLDPLSHRRADHGIQVINATGTDDGVRSEAGLLYGPRTGVGYAVTVQFTDSGLATRLRVLEALRTVGYDLLEHVH